MELGTFRRTIMGWVGYHNETYITSISSGNNGYYQKSGNNGGCLGGALTVRVMGKYNRRKKLMNFISYGNNY